MTEAALVKRIVHFENRVKVTSLVLKTPRQRAAHTQAKNLLNQSLRQLACLRATGSISHWVFNANQK